MTFATGQVVLCIDDGKRQLKSPSSLVAGDTYIITGLYVGDRVTVDASHGPKRSIVLYNADRFRALDDPTNAWARELCLAADLFFGNPLAKKDNKNAGSG